MSVAIKNPIPFFTDLDGSALESGYVYFGTENLNPEVDPIAVYWDEALTQAVQQPVRTSSGYPMRNGSPSQIYSTVNYSVTVRNKSRRIVFTQASVSIANQPDFGSYNGTETGGGGGGGGDYGTY